MKSAFGTASASPFVGGSNPHSSSSGPPRQGVSGTTMFATPAARPPTFEAATAPSAGPPQSPPTGNPFGQAANTGVNAGAYSAFPRGGKAVAGTDQSQGHASNPFSASNRHQGAAAAAGAQHPPAATSNASTANASAFGAVKSAFGASSFGANAAAPAAPTKTRQPPASSKRRPSRYGDDDDDDEDQDGGDDDEENGEMVDSGWEEETSGEESPACSDDDGGDDEEDYDDEGDDEEFEEEGDGEEYDSNEEGPEDEENDNNEDDWPDEEGSGVMQGDEGAAPTGDETRVDADRVDAVDARYPSCDPSHGAQSNDDSGWPGDVNGDEGSNNGYGDQDGDDGDADGDGSDREAGSQGSCEGSNDAAQEEGEEDQADEPPPPTSATLHLFNPQPSGTFVSAFAAPSTATSGADGAGSKNATGSLFGPKGSSMTGGGGSVFGKAAGTGPTAASAFGGISVPPSASPFGALSSTSSAMNPLFSSKPPHTSPSKATQSAPSSTPFSTPTAAATNPLFSKPAHAPRFEATPSAPNSTPFSSAPTPSRVLPPPTPSNDKFVRPEPAAQPATRRAHDDRHDAQALRSDGFGSRAQRPVAVKRQRPATSCMLAQRFADFLDALDAKHGAEAGVCLEDACFAPECALVSSSDARALKAVSEEVHAVAASSPAASHADTWASMFVLAAHINGLEGVLLEVPAEAAAAVPPSPAVDWKAIIIAMGESANALLALLVRLLPDNRSLAVAHGFLCPTVPAWCVPVLIHRYRVVFDRADAAAITCVENKMRTLLRQNCFQMVAEQTLQWSAEPALMAAVATVLAERVHNDVAIDTFQAIIAELAGRLRDGAGVRILFNYRLGAAYQRKTQYQQAITYFAQGYLLCSEDDTHAKFLFAVRLAALMLVRGLIPSAALLAEINAPAIADMCTALVARSVELHALCLRRHCVFYVDHNIFTVMQDVAAPIRVARFSAAIAERGFPQQNNFEQLNSIAEAVARPNRAQLAVDGNLEAQPAETEHDAAAEDRIARRGPLANVLTEVFPLLMTRHILGKATFGGHDGHIPCEVHGRPFPQLAL